MMPQESHVPPPPHRVQRGCVPNILVVGETGAGKSSVINLISGKELAEVSARANGCTLDAASYDMALRDDQGIDCHIRLFDTVGLNEPSLSKNDYFTAIQKANTLIGKLQSTGGISLLIFCIRAGRITSVMQKNYLLFRYVLCQNQVPIAFVITGTENEDPMENWWKKNEEKFKQSKLFCSSHVCVTATRGLNGVYANRYEESQVEIRKMLLKQLSGGASWRPSERKSWFFHLASRLLRWVTNLNERKRALPGKPKQLNEEELKRCLEGKCGFTHEEAEKLAEKILAHHVGGGIREEDVGYLSGACQIATPQYLSV